MVEMQVNLPPDMPPSDREALLTREREYSQALQRSGHWEHLWRVAGRYANVSIFNVDSPDELQELVSGLPLFGYMDTRVTALAHHPSAIETGEQS
jgi:muconolactone D-isomerase